MTNSGDSLLTFSPKSSIKKGQQHPLGEGGSWVGPHHHWAVVLAGGSGRGSRCATDLLRSQPRGENYTRECHEGPEEAAAGRRRSKVSGTWNISSQIGGGGERRSKARENAHYHWGQRSKRASVITGRSESVSDSHWAWGSER